MLDKIAENVYALEWDSSVDRPVLGLVCGENWSIMIDAGNSVGHATLMMEQMKKLNLPHPKYIVYTHSHWDHVFGASAIDADIICCSETREQLEVMRDLKWTDAALAKRVEEGTEIEFCERYIKLEMPDTQRKIPIVLPTIVYERELELNIEDECIHMFRVKCDHAQDAVVVHVKNENILFVGDALYMNMYAKEWHFTSENYIPLLHKLKKLKAKLYVPSHHGSYTYNEFCAYVEQVECIADIVSEHMSMEEAKKAFEAKELRRPTEHEEELLQGFVGQFTVREK
ncbi:MAG: MBL fold metallo-hydrolase [Bacilli bacterium]